MLNIAPNERASQLLKKQKTRIIFDKSSGESLLSCGMMTSADEGEFALVICVSDRARNCAQASGTRPTCECGAARRQSNEQCFRVENDDMPFRAVSSAYLGRVSQACCWSAANW
jgi:hypothetical protein